MAIETAAGELISAQLGDTLTKDLAELSRRIGNRIITQGAAIDLQVAVIKALDASGVLCNPQINTTSPSVLSQKLVDAEISLDAKLYATKRGVAYIGELALLTVPFGKVVDRRSEIRQYMENIGFPLIDDVLSTWTPPYWDTAATNLWNAPLKSVICRGAICGPLRTMINRGRSVGEALRFVQNHDRERLGLLHALQYSLNENYGVHAAMFVDTNWVAPKCRRIPVDGPAYELMEDIAQDLNDFQPHVEDIDFDTELPLGTGNLPRDFHRKTVRILDEFQPGEHTTDFAGGTNGLEDLDVEFRRAAGEPRPIY